MAAMSWVGVDHDGCRSRRVGVVSQPVMTRVAWRPRPVWSAHSASMLAGHTHTHTHTAKPGGSTLQGTDRGPGRGQTDRQTPFTQSPCLATGEEERPR